MGQATPSPSPWMGEGTLLFPPPRWGRVRVLLLFSSPPRPSPTRGEGERKPFPLWGREADHGVISDCGRARLVLRSLGRPALYGWSGLRCVPVPILYAGVFGSHEMLHILSMGGTLCHFVFVVRYILPYPRLPASGGVFPAAPVEVSSPTLVVPSEVGSPQAVA